jgi:hypothetical protein
MRSPLPLFSASEPSGLKIRRPKSAAVEGTAHQQAVGAGSAVPLAEDAGGPRRVPTGQALPVHGQVVVPQPVRLVERQRAHRPATLPKRPSRAMPSSWLFSGWNWAPHTDPRDTREAKRSPYSETPATQGSSAAGRA